MRPTIGRRAHLAAFAALGLLVAGCPSSVPYQEPTNKETPENPPGDDAAATVAAEELDTAPKFEVDPDALSQLEPIPRREPEPEPENVPPKPSGRQPWQTAESDSPSSSDTPDLFANAPAPDAESTSESPADDKPANDFGSLLEDEYSNVQVANRDNDATKSRPNDQGSRYAAGDDESANTEDEFGDQLAQAYAGLLGSSAETEPQTEPPAVPVLEPEPEPQIAATPADPPSMPSESGGSLLPFGDPEPVTEPIAETNVDPSEDASPLDDLWDSPETPEALDPTEVELPPPMGIAEAPVEAAPADLTPAAPAPDLVADPPVSPSLPFDDSFPETADPAEGTDPSTGPFEPTEPPAIASLTPELTAEPDSPDTAAETIEPLPEVPVLAINTKHLAWLLGAKLGLAELADLDGATPAETAAWAEEVDRLSRELGVTRPAGTSKTGPAAVRVSALLQAAAATGEELAIHHGADHAALLEIALKTNALLMIDSNRPGVATVVHDAVELAAAKAMLPSFIWKDAVDRMAESNDSAETLEAVSDLHEKVERFLR